MGKYTIVRIIRDVRMREGQIIRAILYIMNIYASSSKLLQLKENDRDRTRWMIRLNDPEGIICESAFLHYLVRDSNGFCFAPLGPN